MLNPEVADLRRRGGAEVVAVHVMLACRRRTGIRRDDACHGTDMTGQPAP
ncbi:hypothetical protein AB0883_20765 [Micromonospora sp. NPDC047812]